MNIDAADNGVPMGLQRVIGDKTGLLETVISQIPDRNEPVPFQTTPVLTSLKYLLETEDHISLNITGKGTDFERSVESCIGELVERYSMSWPDRDRMVRTSYAELAASQEVVDFAYLNQFSDSFREEYLAEFTRETDILWESGTNLLTGEEVYVPAELIWNKIRFLEDEPMCFLGTSNGVAAGPTTDAAMLWALYELIERDGIMRTWWRHDTPPSVDIDDLPWLEEFSERHLPNDDLSIRIFECESKVDIPTYLSALVNERDEYPNFLVAGGADLDMQSAIVDAAVESCQGWIYTHHLKNIYDVDSIDADDIVRTLEKNLLYYASPDNFEAVSFLFDGPTLQPDQSEYTDVSGWSIRERLDYLLEQVAQAGCTPIAFDLTSEDIANSGSNVARIVVPELVGLTPSGAVPSEHPAFSGETLVEKPHPFP